MPTKEKMILQKKSTSSPNRDNLHLKAFLVQLSQTLTKRPTHLPHYLQLSTFSIERTTLYRILFVDLHTVEQKNWKSGS